MNNDLDINQTLIKVVEELQKLNNNFLEFIRLQQSLKEATESMIRSKSAADKFN